MHHILENRVRGQRCNQRAKRVRTPSPSPRPSPSPPQTKWGERERGFFERALAARSVFAQFVFARFVFARFAFAQFAFAQFAFAQFAFAQFAFAQFAFARSVRSLLPVRCAGFRVAMEQKAHCSRDGQLSRYREDAACMALNADAAVWRAATSRYASYSGASARVQLRPSAYARAASPIAVRWARSRASWRARAAMPSSLGL